MSGINDIKSTSPISVNKLTDPASGNKQPVDKNTNSTSLPDAASDTFSLTDEATLLQNVQQQIAKAPVVNESRVAELKAAIEDGTYQVDSQELARKLIDFEGGF